jgi:lipid II:glycine glycyltransferase (peptidoglycan interpeptide bridge formation enzyme)
VQFRNTLALDLRQEEGALLAQMNQGTRRKIRAAEKAGVVIRLATREEWPALYALYQQTGERGGFLIRPAEYYFRLWAAMGAAGMARILVAEWEGRVVAGAVILHFGPKAYYFYGMSGEAGREAYPNHLLQWTAIRWARGGGYALYDWWGAPNHFREDDPMWGVYRFKDGFGGEVLRYIGAWDYVPYPPLYWAYERALPWVLGRRPGGGGE